MAKYIQTQAKGKPTVIFIAGNSSPYAYYMHTAQETKLYYAQSVANGANVWYGVHGATGLMDTPGGRAAERFAAFIRDHADVSADTRPVSNVALMWSTETARTSICPAWPSRISPPSRWPGETGQEKVRPL
jgi:hypothetical protein